MNSVYRIKCRINQEGFRDTVKYCLCVGCSTLYKCLQSFIFDLIYSGKLLNGNHKTRYKHLGSNDVYHTEYSVMPLIFSNIDITVKDVLVDVGCGKGRVINYWLSKGLKNKIVGLELDPVIASQTAKQFSRWKNVNIIAGDAVYNLPVDGTIFYFYNPFCREKVIEFEARMYELSKGKDVRIVYYNPKSINVFDNGNWIVHYINFENELGLKRWGRINKYHDLAIITRPT